MNCGRHLPTRFISIKLCRFFGIKSCENKSFQDRSPNIHYLSNISGLSANKCGKILEQHKKLLDVSRKDLYNTVQLLKKLNFTAEDIESKPMILYVNCLTLENRHRALEECGCEQIALPTLFKFLTVINKEVSVLKLHGIIAEGVNVQQSLEQSVSNDVRIKLNYQIDESQLLKNFREQILNAYLITKFYLRESELKNIWTTYGRLRHKSFKSILQMIDILTEELNFPLGKIIKNGYLFHGDPENLRKIIDKVPNIASEPIESILLRRPKIIMTPCESIVKTIEHVKNFGISEKAILKCLEILTLGSETVCERLNEIKQIDELQALITNPRILRLVHYQNKALNRLKYLNAMKVKCASLHILSCDSDAFIRFAREGTDRNKGRDVVIFLANTFQVPEKQIRNDLLKHPNWFHVPIIQVKQCLEFLQKQNFSLHDIINNIHILLYPIHKIEEKIKCVYNDDFYKESQIDTTHMYVSHSKMLTLCLYLLELEFHFTGDGVWNDQYSHNVENFNNFIPDFLENNRKIYKYGGKPSQI